MFVIQSVETGKFLAPNYCGMPDWVMLLTDAGLLSDYETAAELVIEHLDFDCKVLIIDLSKL